MRVSDGVCQGLEKRPEARSGWKWVGVESGRLRPVVNAWESGNGMSWDHVTRLQAPNSIVRGWTRWGVQLREKIAGPSPQCQQGRGRPLLALRAGVNYLPPQGAVADVAAVEGTREL